LQGVDTTGAPRPGKHNWFRGGTVRTFDEQTQRALAVDGVTWARGRGWALWKALVTCARTAVRADQEAEDALRVLGEIFSEYQAAQGGEDQAGVSAVAVNTARPRT
jgi:aminoglycoside phosphotransferase (APT) family kinase protein